MQVGNVDKNSSAHSQINQTSFRKAGIFSIYMNGQNLVFSDFENRHKMHILHFEKSLVDY